MLSLVGSLQADPFSPEHVPEVSQSTTQPTQNSNEFEVPNVDPEEEPSDSEEVDTFNILHRSTNDAQMREASQREQEAEDEKEQKRKRKEARAEKKRKKGI